MAWHTALSLPSYVGMGLMVLAGACLQGVGGIGFAMFCAPVAALCFPELVPGPLLLLGCPLALLTLVREHRDIDWPAAGSAIAGRLGGTALATAAMMLLPVSTLSVLFALLILAGVGMSLAGWQVAGTPSHSALAGVASGLMGTITSSGAPPFAIALQRLPPARLRATLGCVFFIGAVVSLIALALIGRLHTAQVVLGALLLPWMLAGFAASGPLNRRLPARALRPVLLAMAAFGALAVLVQTALAAQ